MPSFPREHADLLRYFTSGDGKRIRSVWPDNLYKHHAEPAGWRYMHVGAGSRSYHVVHMPEEDDFGPEFVRRVERRLRELRDREPDVVQVLARRFGERLREELVPFGAWDQVALEQQARQELRGAGILAVTSPPWQAARARTTIFSLGYRVQNGTASPDQRELASAIRRWCEARTLWALSRYAGRAEREAA